MDVDDRLAFIMREPTEEVVTADELQALIETKTHPRHYIGLEISGMLHIGSLVMTGFKINDFMKAGINTTVFLADWHTYINDKMGGDWDRIKKVSQYYTEAFKFFCPGVNIVLGSDLYKKTQDYWENFVRFSKHMTLARTMRSLTIMGRSEAEKNLDLSQLLYPPMQSVDIKAFCPVGVAADNPILELVHYVVFHEFDEFVIERPTKYGGSITYTSYKDLERDFVTKKIHPMDLKNSTATYVNKIVEPIRKHFKGREPQLG